jgi:hypothetical protein
MRARWHYKEPERRSVLCGRVPGWAASVNDPKHVTCRWCLKLLAELERIRAAAVAQES